MTRQEILTAALETAGCLWTDRQQVGTLAEQLRAVADSPAMGGDCDLTDDDRAELRRLAVEAENAGNRGG